MEVELERGMVGLAALLEAVDKVEAGDPPTETLTDEAKTVALELGLVVVDKGGELFVDENTESGVEDRISDDAVVAIVRTADETLSEDAEAAVADVSTTDCVGVDAPELVVTSDGEVDIVEVSAALLKAFAMNLAMSRPGLMANTIPSWQ